MMFIITDGCTEDVCSQNELLRDLNINNIDVYIIGVGSSFDLTKLQCLVNNKDEDIFSSSQLEKVESLICPLNNGIDDEEENVDARSIFDNYGYDQNYNNYFNHRYIDYNTNNNPSSFLSIHAALFFVLFIFILSVCCIGYYFYQRQFNIKNANKIYKKVQI